MPTLEAITPRFPVPDIESALAFYIDRLGFALGWKWGSPPTHANVCRDSIAIDLILAPSRSGGAAMAYVSVTGVEELHGELQRRGVRLNAIEDRDYGMRDFEVVDPFGNRLAFGQPTS